MGQVFGPSVDNLVAQLTRLPGIGTRTAQRLAFDLLSVSQRPDLVDWIVPLARNGLLPPIPPEQVGADEADYELLRSGLTTTPLRCWTDPVRLTGAGERVPRTYIWCLRSGFGKIARRLREDPTWDVRELDTTHMATYTVPNELAALLLELA